MSGQKEFLLSGIQIVGNYKSNDEVMFRHSIAQRTMSFRCCLVVVVAVVVFRGCLSVFVVVIFSVWKGAGFCTRYKRKYFEVDLI